MSLCNFFLSRPVALPTDLNPWEQNVSCFPAFDNVKVTGSALYHAMGFMSKLCMRKPDIRDQWIGNLRQATSLLVYTMAFITDSTILINVLLCCVHPLS